MGRNVLLAIGVAFAAVVGFWMNAEAGTENSSSDLVESVRHDVAGKLDSLAKDVATIKAAVNAAQSQPQELDLNPVLDELRKLRAAQDTLQSQVESMNVVNVVKAVPGVDVTLPDKTVVNIRDYCLDHMTGTFRYEGDGLVGSLVKSGFDPGELAKADEKDLTKLYDAYHSAKGTTASATSSDCTCQNCKCRYTVTTSAAVATQAAPATQCPGGVCQQPAQGTYQTWTYPVQASRPWRFQKSR